MNAERVTRRWTDDRGAVTVLVAALLPVLLLASAMAMDSMAVSMAEQEHQRAADAGALAAAATIPLVDLSGLPVGGGAWGPGASAAERGCVVAADLLADAPSTRAHAPVVGDCAVTFEPDDPALLDAVADAADGVVAVSSVLAPLGVASVTELLHSLVPAFAAPRARAVTSSGVTPPMGAVAPVTLDAPEVAGEAVARRRLKNAVLLPVLDLSGACPADGLLAGVLQWVTGSLGSLLADAGSIGDLAGDLAQCRADVNGPLDESATALFDELDAVGVRLDQLGFPGSTMAASLRRDLQDIADPSGMGAPTQRDVLEAAAERDEHILVVLVGVIDATAIPILDVFPVLASDLRALDPSNLSMAELFGLTADAAQARGLFRATLVR